MSVDSGLLKRFLTLLSQEKRRKWGLEVHFNVSFITQFSGILDSDWSIMLFIQTVKINTNILYDH